MARSYLSTSSLRQAIYDRMSDEWGLKYDLKLTKLLAQLLGRKADSLLGGNVKMSDAEIEICKKLLGEHGYAYYKMLLAQMEDAS